MPFEYSVESRPRRPTDESRQTLIEMPSGMRACAASHVALHGVGDLDHVLVADPVHADHHRRLAVEARALVGVLEAVDHSRDVAEPHARAVGAREHDELFELAADVRLRLRAQQDLAALGLDRAAGQVERRRGARPARPGRSSAPWRRSAASGTSIEISYGRAFVTSTWVMRGIRGELVAHALGELLQAALVGVAEDRDVGHRPADGDLRDDRLLGFVGKRVERIDLVLHVCDGAASRRRPGAAPR